LDPSEIAAFAEMTVPSSNEPCAGAEVSAHSSVIPANAGISDGSQFEPVETPDLDRLDQRVELDQRVVLDKLDQPTFRRGVRIALDWGKARIGVAACDPDGTLAYPVETVQTGAAQRRLAELLAEYQPIEVVIGLPRTLAGDEGPAAAHVRAQTAALIEAHPLVSWRFSDERLTTVTASRRLQSAGRKTRRQRAVIDQFAAVAILEEALAVERATGAAPGEPAR